MTYDAAVAALTPRMFYKIEETSGTTMTDSGAVAINGTYTTAANLNQGALYSGGNSYNINGQYGTVAGLATEIAAYTSVSVAAWIQAQSAGEPFVVNCGYDGKVPFSLGDGGANGNSTHFNFGTFAGGWRLVPSTTTIAGGNTYFLVGTIDSTGVIKLYVNGSLEATSSTGATSFSGWTDGHLYVGRRWDTSGTFVTSGNYLEAGVAVFNRVLTATEVSNLYAGIGGGGGSTPVHPYPAALRRQAIIRASSY